MRQLPSQLAVKIYRAAELIAERGINDAKIDDIAEASGIPVATLYYYFRGKEEILTFLLDDLLEAIAGSVGAAIGRPGSTLDRLRWAVEAQLEVMGQNPAACRVLVGDLGRATRLPELAAALDAAFHRPLSKLLEEGVADGSISAVADPGKTAMSIFGAITIAGLTGAVTAPNDTLAFVEETGVAVCELLIDGLRPRPSPA